MKVNKKILALFGGSFNPPHLGHRLFAEAILAKIQPQKLLVLPAKNPFKADETFSEFNSELISATFSGLDLTIDWHDYNSITPGYIANSLKRIAQAHRGRTIQYFIGIELLTQIHLWHNFQTIFELAELHAVCRKGYKTEVPRAIKIAKIHNWDLPEISSTDLRNNKGDNLYLRKWLAPPAYDYYTKHQE